MLVSWPLSWGIFHAPLRRMYNRCWWVECSIYACQVHNDDVFYFAFILLHISHNHVHFKHFCIPHWTWLWNSFSNIYEMSPDLVSLRQSDHPPTSGVGLWFLESLPSWMCVLFVVVVEKLGWTEKHKVRK